MITTLDQARQIQMCRKEAGKPGLAAAVSRYLRREHANKEEYERYLSARATYRAAVRAHQEAPTRHPHPGTFGYRFTSPNYLAALRSVVAPSR